MNIQRIQRDEIKIINNNRDPADRRKHSTPRLPVRTGSKAGGVHMNHGLAVRTSIKAGGVIIHD